MNFFSAKLERADGGLMVDAKAFRLPVPPAKADTCAPYIGKAVVFGIRPEDIHDPTCAPRDIHGSAVETRVDVSELMGNEIFLYLVSGENSFIARVDPRTQARMGDRTQVMFNMDNMHLFMVDGEQQAIR
jgi:multiple sugar transport system ATP-binding protein